ncbi:hypothetical protein KFK09_003985 [Dendrobium nobile]|uniref:Uncharacterized protein n=1 Tax=Dendrobium nobile TaxID=94219 RepID=A0A8T3C4Z5_DENNO|nr:hypothetical protein KFK09_003985 [Dendrobium nobile]
MATFKKNCINWSLSLIPQGRVKKHLMRSCAGICAPQMATIEVFLGVMYWLSHTLLVSSTIPWWITHFRMRGISFFFSTLVFLVVFFSFNFFFVCLLFYAWEA